MNSYVPFFRLHNEYIIIIHLLKYGTHLDIRWEEGKEEKRIFVTGLPLYTFSFQHHPCTEKKDEKKVCTFCVRHIVRFIHFFVFIIGFAP